MKKFNLSLILFIFGVFFNTLTAQRAINTQKLGLWLEAGEWSMMPRESELKNSLGGAGALGFVYEFQRNHFLLDLGVGAMGGHTVFSTFDGFGSVDMTRTMVSVPAGVRSEFVYQLRNRKDSYTAVNVKIPVLVGGTWDRFYFLAGAKFNINVWNQCGVKGSLDTYGHYTLMGQQIYDDFHNMPLYEFEDGRPYSGKATASFNLDIAASAEIGARLGYIEEARGWDVPKAKNEYRLAIFADYGILDFHKANTLPMMQAPNYYQEGHMISALQVNDVLATDHIAKAVNNLLVGVKFTIFFKMPTHFKCVTCQEAHRSHYRGRTQILKEPVF